MNLPLPEPDASANVRAVIAGIFIALLCGTTVRIVALRSQPEDIRVARISSLKTWWVLAVILSVSLIFDRWGVVVVLAIAGTLGMREFLRLIGSEHLGRPSIVAAYVLLLSFHMAVAFSGPAESSPSVRVFALTPFLVVFVFASLRALSGLTDGFIRSTGSLVWSVLLFGYCLGYAVTLFDLNLQTHPVVGKAGWFLFLVLLTEINDIMQAVTGRKFGRIRITPRVSPRKSLEGLIGGILTTTVLAVCLAPWLTSLTHNRSSLAGLVISAGAGLLIALTGFLGDISMSGVKRDAGVKDGSRLLPGHGGMIDRIDSLIFTAPAFNFYVQWVMS